MSLETRQIYRFGCFTLDPTAKVLLRDGEPVRLARKAVETLLALVEHPGQVLTKDELIEAIWQGRVVDEANLIQNIAVVRRTLGLLAGQPGYIETFPGRGYRLLGPIVAEEEEPRRPQRAAPLEAVAAAHLPENGHAPPAVPPQDRRRMVGRRAGLVAATVICAAALAAWLIWRSSSRPGEQPGFRRTAVARLGGKEFQPAISADGANVAFVLERGDGRLNRICIRMGQSAPVLMGKEGWEYTSPAWSPDGKHLAFMRFGSETGELLIASAESREEERAVTNVFRTRFGLAARHLDWSPDGTTLAFDDTAAPDIPFAIFLISLSNGARRQITAPPPGSLGDVEPRFSPDGRGISFIRAFHRARQGLFTAQIDGTGLKAVSKDNFQISGQDWTPDGRAIVLGSNQSGDFRLWRINMRQPATRPKEDWTATYGDAPLQLSIARRAPVLVYSVLQEDFNIWRLDLAAKEESPDRWTRIVNSSAQDVSPQYSPDKKRICFRSDRTGEEQLWEAAADGSSPRQITRGALRPSVGRWSPDSNAIVFNDSREMDMYVAKPAEDGSWQVTPVGVKGLHPVFSEDGRWIYAGRFDKILRVPAQGGEATIISSTQGLSFGLSADGKSLYFVREITDSTLWQLSLETGKISKVLTGLVPYCSSCWAASGSGVYYLGAKRASVNGQAIYFHADSGGRDKLIAEYQEPLLPLGSGPFSISADGRYLLCVRVDPSNCDVMRIEPYH